MTLDTLRTFLGWCLLMNAGLLIFWFLLYVLGRDMMYRRHAGLFHIPVETFDAIHYAGLAAYKILIFLLNLVPYLALVLMGSGS